MLIDLVWVVLPADGVSVQEMSDKVISFYKCSGGLHVGKISYSSVSDFNIVQMVHGNAIIITANI